MAQHDYIIANQSGAAFRSDLNNGLAAIVSQNSGAAQPSTTYAYQWWADTTTGLLKIRNAANNAWITIGTLADANLGLLSLAGGTLTGNLTLNAQSDLRLADADSSNWVALQAPATVATNLTLTAPAADGSADQSLVTNGSGVLSFASRSRLVRGTSVASTSGVSISFTSLPNWIKKITMMINGVSTSGSADILIRLSTGGVFASSGYVSNMQVVQGGVTSGVNNTVGFVISQGTSSVITTGTYEFVNNDGNGWIGTGVFAYEHAVVGAYGGGRITLGGVLDGIRIITANGSDTFDAGSVNIIYEG
jgi:hypothetical protein